MIARTSLVAKSKVRASQSKEPDNKIFSKFDRHRTPVRDDVEAAGRYYYGVSKLTDGHRYDYKGGRVVPRLWTAHTALTRRLLADHMTILRSMEHVTNIHM